ncbi:MAG: hypothetical protein HY291_16550 [Planctomycetes bacterium]|nr:hypothetical protein [Planctomycetota bacterium]
MEQGQPPPAQAPAAETRIPFSFAYLLAVVAGAAANAFVFALLVRHYIDGMLETSLLVAISAFFGLLFAGGCNVTAQTFARWFNRRSVLDRILFFTLVTLLGDVFLVLIMPFVVQHFQ